MYFFFLKIFKFQIENSENIDYFDDASVKYLENLDNLFILYIN